MTDKRAGDSVKNLIRKAFNQKEEIQWRKRQGVPYFYFPLLENSGLVSHGFSTRLGGVSRGCYESMNLSPTKADSPENVRENYRRLCAALGVDEHKTVLSRQTHTTNVRKVTEEDWGKGVFRERDYDQVDGLMTDVPGTVLVTFYADCVPLYFLDPVHRAVAVSHSGWRGTAAGMGARTLEAMREAYGTRPEEVLAAIGPSICGDCYEVGEEVAEHFSPSCLRKNERGRWQLDLWEANREVLLQAGIRPEHLAVTDVCTRCNPDIFYSHRVMGEQRGIMGALIALRETVGEKGNL